MKRNANHPLLAFAILLVCAISLVIIVVAASTPENVAEPEATETAEPSQAPVLVVTPTTVISTVETSEPVKTWEPDEAEVEAIAKVLYRECRGVPSKAEQAAVAWCILNRVDSNIPYFPDTVLGVITQKNQFAWDENAPLLPDLVTLARDVLIRWHAEGEGAEDVGRTLPAEYVYFVGDGRHNNFSIEWRSGIYWTWDYADPYTVEAVW